ncbi:hypothetical protein [Actinomyces howellii]|uniref:Ti-type conjugative transfer relaxase TraA n=1 Tax=Actinomyces howellii TaxID=52771 RepID=A0A3S4R2I6_9ACTO|nr:hypothetical protein [Actinomyces howellii]VEG29963.1 Ti-type conjugative transfer relaxase TraA [Actinomyces howellii]
MNERIRTGRIERSEVDDAVTATGSDGLSIGASDLIQPRENDTRTGVANRRPWIVQHATGDSAVYAREAASGHRRPRAVTLPAEYVAEQTHLSHAATADGVQGATVDASHTILSETISAAGVYVRMTRGSETDRLHVAAEDRADARLDAQSAAHHAEDDQNTAVLHKAEPSGGSGGARLAPSSTPRPARTRLVVLWSIRRLDMVKR